MTDNTKTEMKMITCLACKKDFEKSPENFYTYKGKLVTAKCKKCRSAYNSKYSKNDYVKYKEYYTEYAKKYAAQKVRCEACNMEIKKSSLRGHLKTKRHLKNIEVSEETNDNDDSIVVEVNVS